MWPSFNVERVRTEAIYMLLDSGIGPYRLRVQWAGGVDPEAWPRGLLQI